MFIGEVSLNTNDVVRIANFYKELLKIENDSSDEVHQARDYTIIRSTN